jgi:hypothetical protein
MIRNHTTGEVALNGFLANSHRSNIRRVLIGMTERAASGSRGVRS